MFINGRKALAVAVLSEVWAGAKLPPPLIELAEEIRAQMIEDGTWISA